MTPKVRARIAQLTPAQRRAFLALIDAALDLVAPPAAVEHTAKLVPAKPAPSSLELARTLAEGRRRRQDANVIAAVTARRGRA